MSLAKEPQLFIVEERARTDRFCADKGEKQYRVRDKDGKQDLFIAHEELDLCCRSCSCLCRRDFDINFEDKASEPVTMTHGFMCCSWFHCCSICRHRAEISRKEQKIGAVQSDCSLCCTCYPTFTVTDEKDKEIYSVAKDIGCCTALFGGCGCGWCRCVIPEGYTITGKNGNGNATIEEIPTGTGRTEQTFLLKFPADADENHRVLLLSATFLVDYALSDKDRDHDKEAPPAQKMG